MKSIVSCLLAVLPVSMLGGCSPEGFEIQPCSANGMVGFRIQEIDGWFWDYQPRPDSILVKAEGTSTAPGAHWHTELKYFGSSDKVYASRPARELIIYGQKLSGWTLEQRPRLLEPGESYQVWITDNGRNGWATFIASDNLPICRKA